MEITYANQKEITVLGVCFADLVVSETNHTRVTREERVVANDDRLLAVPRERKFID